MRITRVHADSYSSNELEKLDIALELFSHAVNSVQFQRTIEQHIPFDTGSNLSNQQIYGIIMSGDEAFTNEGVDFEADLDLTMDFRTSTDMIGFTIDERIFTFRNFFHQLLPTKLAGHYAHEYCHTLGFADPGDLRVLSGNVPYEVGRIIEELSISNHRLFITTNLNVNNDQDLQRMNNFRNATVIDSETIDQFASDSDQLLPSRAKLKKARGSKKTKTKKTGLKKSTRRLVTKKKKTKAAVKGAKPTRKKIAK